MPDDKKPNNTPSQEQPAAPKHPMTTVRVLTQQDFDLIRDAVREAPYKVAAPALAALDNRAQGVQVPVVDGRAVL